MMRKILIPLDSSEFTPAAVSFAAAMAKAERSRKTEPVALLGLSVADTDHFPVGRFAGLVPREELLKDAQTKTEALLERFRVQAASLKLKKTQVEARAVTGSPFREIIRQGVFCDVIVTTRTCSFPPVDHDYDTLAHLYHHASRPVVIAADSFRPVKKVIMTMDGTAPASRMMYAYAHLNPFPEAKVKVVFSKAEEAEYGLTGFFENVKSFLKSYGIAVETEGLTGNFGQQLVATVREEGAELLAMGIPAEHFLAKLRETLRLQDYSVQKILARTGASLFTVH